MLKLRRLVPLRWRQLYWRFQLLPSRSRTALFREVSPRDWFKVLRLLPDPLPGLRQETTIRLRDGCKVILRTYGTDPWVFDQIFLKNQYDAPFIPRGSCRTIIDAGANIGLASLYFLRKFPEARVVALEPDPANYQLAVRNTSEFRDRCRMLDAALWSSSMSLALFPGDGAWGTQVRTVDGAGDVRAIGVPDLLHDFEIETVDLFKMDIEGAEDVVLPSIPPGIADHIRCWMVELHGPAAEQAFASVASRESWDVWSSGEITTATRRSAPEDARY